MNNLEYLFQYTLQKKEHQINRLSTHYSESIKDIEGYIKNSESVVGATMGFEYLSIWYSWCYNYSFLKKSKIESTNLVFATKYGLESNNIRYFLGKKSEKYKQAIQFHKSIKHMAQMLLLGWDELAINYGHLLIKMLYGKQYKGWHPGYKHPWFMLELFCKWQNIDLDYNQLNYPEDMGVYKEVLLNWDTKDRLLLSELVDKLVDFHISESDEDEYEDKIPDFPSSDYFVFAIEIILWLNIRERIGLPDYSAQNELMQLPINDWHTQNITIPQIELVEQAKAKLLIDYPGLQFEI